LIEKDFAASFGGVGFDEEMAALPSSQPFSMHEISHHDGNLITVRVWETLRLVRERERDPDPSDLAKREVMLRAG
jgi:hypothetical protein